MIAALRRKLDRVTRDAGMPPSNHDLERPEPREKVTQTRRDLAAVGQSKGVGLATLAIALAALDRQWRARSSVA